VILSTELMRQNADPAKISDTDTATAPRNAIKENGPPPDGPGATASPADSPQAIPTAPIAPQPAVAPTAQTDSTVTGTEPAT
jgi:hypothetical protein